MQDRVLCVRIILFLLLDSLLADRLRGVRDPLAVERRAADRQNADSLCTLK